MSDDLPRPYAYQIVAYSEALARLEGWSFGCPFSFTTIYGVLNHGLDNGWSEVPGFKHLPGLYEFSQELTAAMKPVVDKYAAELRQHLANECVGVAKKALK